MNQILQDEVVVVDDAPVIQSTPEWVAEDAITDRMHLEARMWNIALFITVFATKLRSAGYTMILAPAMRDCVRCCMASAGCEPALAPYRDGDLEHHGLAIGPEGLDIKRRQFPRAPYRGIWLIELDDSTITKCQNYLDENPQSRIPHELVATLEDVREAIGL